MKIKVYNENGNIKITKSGKCQTEETLLFHTLADGDVAEIDIEVADFTTNCKSVQIKK